METNKKDNRYNNIIKDLNSGDNKKILTAVKQLRKHGKAEAFGELYSVYKESSDEIKEVIQDLFFDLKDESVTTNIVSTIENENDDTLQGFLVSILWQSSLDSSEFISNLVSIAIKGSYLTCFEVLTVIEQYETAFNNEEIQDLIFDITDVIEEDDSNKKDVLISLKTVIENLPVEY